MTQTMGFSTFGSKNKKRKRGTVVVATGSNGVVVEKGRGERAGMGAARGGNEEGEGVEGHEGQEKGQWQEEGRWQEEGQEGQRQRQREGRGGGDGDSGDEDLGDMLDDKSPALALLGHAPSLPSEFTTTTTTTNTNTSTNTTTPQDQDRIQNHEAASQRHGPGGIKGREEDGGGNGHGIRKRNEREAYYDASFVEDPWRGLR